MIPALTASTPRPRQWQRGARWFAAEFFVVVTGVLAAIALNAWWGGVKDREVETDSLRELRAALVSDIDGIRGNIATHRKAEASGRLIREHLRAGNPYADTLDALFGGVLVATYSTRDEAAYETLKQRGLETITNDSIRIAVGRLYGVEYPRVLGFQGPALEFTMDKVFPFYIRHFRDVRFFRNATPVDYTTLQTSTEYAGLLDWLIDTHSIEADLMEELEISVSGLIELLDVELANR